jgi:glycosyltransferase involved in cell wall biosynthesis
MKASIILCTYNRHSSLANALESAAALSLPDSMEWEVLVVDNNSSDRTRAVTEDFCCRYPGRFRYLFEPQPGKSYALNTGVAAARGDVLAFMDDDVTVASAWLRNLTAALTDGCCVGAGGRILPVWSSEPPRWLPRGGRYRLAPLALFDLGEQSGPLTEPPFGTNMVFRKEMFEKYGGFRTDLGPNPNDMIRGEDTEFGDRLLAAGEQLRYVADAVVYHPVSPERAQEEYFLRWWFDKARADVRRYGTEPGRICLFGVPVVYFRRLASWAARWMVATDSATRLQRKINIWVNAGLIAESYCRVRNGGDADFPGKNTAAPPRPEILGAHGEPPSSAARPK